MKNDAFLSQLREEGWRRQLTEAELAALRAYLASHPEAGADWRLDSALTRALAEMPAAPVPSNFTARVLDAVEWEGSRSWQWSWSWPTLVPRMALAMVVLVFAGLTVYHHEVYNQRMAMVRNVALVAGSQPLPSADALENFDAIRRLGQPQHADDELLALMQ